MPLLRALAQVWLLLCVALAFFLLAEVTLRVVFFVRDSLWPRNPYVHLNWTAKVFAGSEWIGRYADEYERSRVFEWYPYVYWRAAPFKGRLINIAPGGIRRTWSSSECRADDRVTKVFMFGGSALWGTGARDDFTIPSWVARKLAERGYRRVCVVNWGESGYVSTQGVLTLLLQIRDGNVPDVIVFYDGVNDIFVAYQSGVAGIPQNEMNRRAEFNLTKRGGEMIARGIIVAVKASSVYRLWSKVWKGLLDGRGGARSGSNEINEGGTQVRLADDIVRTYAANVEIVRRLGRQYGFKALFYWQPVAFLSKLLTADEEQQVKRERYLEGLVKITYARVTVHERLRGTGDFRDVSGVFRDTKGPVFIDFVHTLERDNERVAEEIVRDLTPILEAGRTGSGRGRRSPAAHLR